MSGSDTAPSWRGRVPWALLLSGAALLGLGLAAARRLLPEWRPLPPADAAWVGRLEEHVRSFGGTLVRPRLSLEGGVSESDRYEQAFRLLGPRGTEYLASTGDAVRHRVDAVLEVPGAGSGSLEVGYAPGGGARSVSWIPGGVIPLGAVDDKVKAARERVGDELAKLVAGGLPLDAGEVTYTSGNVPVRIQELPPPPDGGPKEVVVRTEAANGVSASRSLADPELTLRLSPDRVLSKVLVRLVPAVATVLVVLVVFGVLLYRRRLGVRNGLGLAVLVTLTTVPVMLAAPGPSGVVYYKLLGLVLVAPYLAISWAAAESLFRDTTPGFTTSLDALLAGRLGPRGGRALLAGLGAGAALAGGRLLVLSAAAANADGALRPLRASFGLPFFGLTTNPFLEGPGEACSLILAVALLRLVLPRRWADPAGGLAFALLTAGAAPVSPWLAALLFSLLLGGAYLLVLKRWGFASLLVAATSASLLRDAFAAAHLLPKTAIPFLLAAASLLVLVAVGVAGVRRSEREDEGKVDAPEYVKRLESERRVRYEMDLLARMQLALLPERAPQVPGLDLAARTVLATEVGGDLYEFVTDGGGGLWVAAGDVSGHGYSCGIQGAMVKAALLSLVGDGRSPGAVLGEIDRVLRRAGRTQLFTSLVLLRVDPKTGRGVLANAGHPFPILLSEGRCTEIAVPGLPLGQGPPRTYADVGVELAEGASLVLASDGLFEGTDRFDDPYGYERPAAVLSSVGLWRRPAEAIVEALIADWRLHVGQGAPPDDTTIVVVKRPSLAW